MKYARVAMVLMVISGLAFGTAVDAEQTGEDPVRRTELLPPGPDNPRNSEGDFVRLEDGRVMFVYTHFYGGGSDHSEAYLAARLSDDGGRTWSDEDVKVVPNHADRNVMSVSLLRLRDGRIAMFYLVKNSLEDCRPVMRISRDGAETWSEPIQIIPDDEMGYYVLNNDRVIQLESGRLIVPVSRHNGASWEEWTRNGHQMCYLSDDGGRTWHRSDSVLTGKRPGGERITLQEPGVVQLRDGRLMMWCRTDQGCQFVSYSRDGGETWTQMEPSPLVSPVSPASIERIPSTGDLLVVWNDHRSIPDALRGKRTPLTAAVSRDGGQTWKNAKKLYEDPEGWYCYTAIHFVNDRVLLGHCAGKDRLKQTNITSFPVDWLYR